MLRWIPGARRIGNSVGMKDYYMRGVVVEGEMNETIADLIDGPSAVRVETDDGHDAEGLSEPWRPKGHRTGPGQRASFGVGASPGKVLPVCDAPRRPAAVGRSVRPGRCGRWAHVLPHAPPAEDCRDEPRVLLPRTDGRGALADRATPFPLPGDWPGRDRARVVGKRRAGRGAVSSDRLGASGRGAGPWPGGHSARRTLHHVRDRRTHPRVALPGRCDLPAPQRPVVGRGASRRPGALPVGTRSPQGRQSDASSSPSERHPLVRTGPGLPGPPPRLRAVLRRARGHHDRDPLGSPA